METDFMSGKSLDDLGKLQRAVIEVIWKLGEASVHQVRDRLGRNKKLAYTTVLTTMQKLEKAGWLRHRTEGKSYVYLPSRSREEAGAKSVRRFMKRVFNGNSVMMFQHLMLDDDISDKELLEIRKIIDKKRKGVRK